MAANAKCEVKEDDMQEKVDYLHPEILSTESLIKILKERHILEDELDGLDKYKLVELFYNYVVPLPQRIYGKGRRDRRLTKLRNFKEGMKRPIEASTSNTDDRQQKRPCNQASQFGDRLKPPPSSSDGENKLLKLSNCSTNSSDADRGQKCDNAETKLNVENNLSLRSNFSKQDTVGTEKSHVTLKGNCTLKQVATKRRII